MKVCVIVAQYISEQILLISFILEKRMIISSLQYMLK